MTDKPESVDDLVVYLRKQLLALRLEVPSSIADDIEITAARLTSALERERQQTRAELNALAEEMESQMTDASLDGSSIFLEQRVAGHDRNEADLAIYAWAARLRRIGGEE